MGEKELSTKELSKEVTKAIEAGINKHLNRSLVYSPLKFFYNLFKKNNPDAIDQARKIANNDIKQCLSIVDEFDEGIFVQQNEMTAQGKRLLQTCYNIGISLLKKKLTVMTAFRALKNETVRDKIYGNILDEVKKATADLVNKQIANK